MLVFDFQQFLNKSTRTEARQSCLPVTVVMFYNTENLKFFMRFFFVCDLFNFFLIISMLLNSSEVTYSIL